MQPNQTVPIVKSRVRGRGHSDGSVVDIEQDGIERRGARSDSLGHITFLDADTRVLQGVFRDRAERPAVPLQDRRNQLGDDDKCFRRQNIERRPQGEPHSEPPDEDARPGQGARPATPQYTEGVLRAVRPARHQGLMAGRDDILAGVGSEGQLGSIGGPGPPEDNPGFHGI